MVHVVNIQQEIVRKDIPFFQMFSMILPSDVASDFASLKKCVGMQNVTDVTITFCTPVK